MRIAATDKRFVVRADEKLTAFIELETAIFKNEMKCYAPSRKRS